MNYRPGPRTVRAAVVLAAVVPLLWFGVVAGWRGVAAADLLDQREAALIARRRVERLQEATAAREAAPVAEPTQGHWQLPEQPDVTGTMAMLSALAEDTQVDLVGAKAMATEHPDHVDFALDGTAAPAALCAFLAGIEDHPQLLVIDQGTVAAIEGSRDVAFHFVVSAWHSGGRR